MRQSLGTKDHFELLGVPRDATEASGPGSLLPARQALPPRRAARGRPRRDARRARGHLPPAGRGIRDPAQPANPSRLREEPRARRDGRARPRRRGRRRAGEDASESPEASLARAVESFTSERFWEVIQILEKAVPRAQGALKQRQRVLLARAYARTPDWVKQARGAPGDGRAAGPGRCRGALSPGRHLPRARSSRPGPEGVSQGPRAGSRTRGGAALRRGAAGGRPRQGTLRRTRGEGSSQRTREDPAQAARRRVLRRRRLESPRDRSWPLRSPAEAPAPSGRPLARGRGGGCAVDLRQQEVGRGELRVLAHELEGDLSRPSSSTGGS